MAACKTDDDGGDSSEPFEVTANASGEIEFYHIGGDEPFIPAKITTDLPEPNNSFTLTTEGESKKIEGLESGQKVKGTVSWAGEFANVNITGNCVYIQTYER
jgi:hypothetical protein